MELSVAITAYNESKRGEGAWILACIEAAAAPKNVAEVVVVDDCSDDWPWLQELLRNRPKVKLFYNETNLGVYRNKLRSIELCSCDWVQICDSDDTMGVAHFDCLASLDRNPAKLYCNSFGQPTFDYRGFCGSHNLESYVKLAGDRYFPCLFNTGNHFLHREAFLSVMASCSPIRHQVQVDPEQSGRMHDGADSAFYNSRWLISGNTMEVVPDLEYEHRYHVDSTSAFVSAPIQTELLPPLYFYELYQALDPTLPEAGMAGKTCRFNKWWATYQTGATPITIGLSTFQVCPCGT